MKLIEDLGMKYPTETSKVKSRYGIYECPICLKHFDTIARSVKTGKSTKCKSCAARIRSTTHGLEKHKLYITWNGQKQRCNNINSPGYCSYGGRGIKVSEEFMDFSTWLEYVESLADAYKDAYTLDRIDNDKGYERGNLRWTSKTVQARNTRKLQSNNTSGYRGVSRNGKNWLAQIGVDGKQIHLGTFDSQYEAAQAYDNYILEHNLEHTMNIEYSYLINRKD